MTGVSALLPLEKKHQQRVKYLDNEARKARNQGRGLQADQYRAELEAENEDWAAGEADRQELVKKTAIEARRHQLSTGDPVERAVIRLVDSDIAGLKAITGLSNQDFAQYTGYAPATVANWLYGKKSCPENVRRPMEFCIYTDYLEPALKDAADPDARCQAREKKLEERIRTFLAEKAEFEKEKEQWHLEH